MLDPDKPPGIVTTCTSGYVQQKVPEMQAALAAAAHKKIVWMNHDLPQLYSDYNDIWHNIKFKRRYDVYKYCKELLLA